MPLPQDEQPLETQDLGFSNVRQRFYQVSLRLIHVRQRFYQVSLRLIHGSL